MFKRPLFCVMVVGMMSVGAIAGAATNARETARKSEVPPAPSNASASDSDGQGRSLIAKAILVMHGGKSLDSRQALAASNDQCKICHSFP